MTLTRCFSGIAQSQYWSQQLLVGKGCRTLVRGTARRTQRRDVSFLADPSCRASDRSRTSASQSHASPSLSRGPTSSSSSPGWWRRSWPTSATATSTVRSCGRARRGRRNRQKRSRSSRSSWSSSRSSWKGLVQANMASGASSLAVPPSTFRTNHPRHIARRLTKRKYLRAELGEGTLALMRTVKRALDPLNLLNPGKVLFDED